MRYWLVFHVYVEGVAGTGPDALRQLSVAMASRYGLPAEELHARLARGRFRVKANVDHATANLYARDLEAIGARVRIEDAHLATTARDPRAKVPSDRQVLKTPSGIRISPAIIPRSATSLPPQPASRPASSSLPPRPEPRPSLSTLPPQPTARPTRPSLPPHVASRPSMPALPAHVPSRPSPPSLPAHAASRPVQSTLGIAVDTSSGIEPDASMDLGALDRSGLLSLATLDNEPAPAAPRSVTPPDGGLAQDVAPGSPGPASPPSTDPLRRPELPRSTGALRRADEPSLDVFAPPDAEDASFVVELADDEQAYRARKRMSSPRMLASDPTAGGPATGATSTIAAEPPTRSGPPTTPRLGLARQDVPAPPAATTALASEHRLLVSPRVRFAAGVLLAVVLGFVPAHVVASIREDRAFRAIDAGVLAVQDAADSKQSYDALDAMRAAQLDAKQSAHRRIALTSMLIWAVAGAAVAFVWFRRMPRDLPRGS